MWSEAEIRPFRVAVPESELADLQDRLARVRWAPEPGGRDEGYGVSRVVLQELVEHWRHRYNWRAWEARINSYPQFTTTVDGANVHFLHVLSTEPQRLSVDPEPRLAGLRRGVPRRHRPAE